MGNNNNNNNDNSNNNSMCKSAISSRSLSISENRSQATRAVLLAFLDGAGQINITPAQTADSLTRPSHEVVVEEAAASCSDRQDCWRSHSSSEQDEQNRSLILFYLPEGCTRGSVLPALRAVILSQGITQFLCSPVPEALGLVQFRLVGDHTEDRLWLSLDYEGTEGDPHVTRALVSITRDGSRYLLRGAQDTSALGEVRRNSWPGITQYQASQYTVKTKGGDGEVSISKTNHGLLAKSSLHKVEATMSTELQAMDFVNQEAVWSDRVDAYTLNFHKRVLLASSKNFLLRASPASGLVAPLESESGATAEHCVRFGVIRTKNRQEKTPAQFAVDVAYPLSPLQALGIALGRVATRA